MVAHLTYAWGLCSKYTMWSIIIINVTGSAEVSKIHSFQPVSWHQSSNKTKQNKKQATVPLVSSEAVITEAYYRNKVKQVQCLTSVTAFDSSTNLCNNILTIKYTTLLTLNMFMLEAAFWIPREALEEN